MNVRSLVKKIIPKKLFATVEPYGHWLEAIIENIIFGFPLRKLKVIGVTGTAGKTTTSTLIAHVLRQSGYRVAMMTTVAIDYGDGKGARPNTTRMTSLGSLKLLKAVKKINANNVEWLVLETTSQALSQHRVWGVPYSVVAFTNLGYDNFHYHGSFERYRAAKLMLFKQCNRNLRGQRLGVVNSDDPSGHFFADAVKNKVTYGIKTGELKAREIKLSSSGSEFKVKFNGEDLNVKSYLPGEFNIYNCLAAIGVCRALGLEAHKIEQGISSLRSIEGRMNTVDEGQDFAVIIDYATTPETFKAVFEAVKPLVKGKIITVFGSAGRRDESKRPLIGKTAAKHSSIIILTEEDDRDQDGLQILEDIAAGAQKAGKVHGKDMFLIHKREEAVQKAIDIARPGDLVLLLGKGEETVIITNKPNFKSSPGHIYNESTDTIRRHYNETESAKIALKKRLSK